MITLKASDKPLPETCEICGQSLKGQSVCFYADEKDLEKEHVICGQCGLVKALKCEYPYDTP